MRIPLTGGRPTVEAAPQAAEPLRTDSAAFWCVGEPSGEHDPTSHWDGVSGFG